MALVGRMQQFGWQMDSILLVARPNPESVEATGNPDASLVLEGLHRTLAVRQVDTIKEVLLRYVQLPPGI